jgi:hypothetical protein
MADEPTDQHLDPDTGCTRCDAPLVFLGQKSFHEGGGALNVLFGGPQGMFENRERIEMWACEECGHVEFFMPIRR